MRSGAVLSMILLAGCSMPVWTHQPQDHPARVPERHRVQIEYCNCPTAPVIGIDRLGDTVFVHHQVTLTNGTSFVADDVFRVVRGREGQSPESRTGRESKR